MKFEHYTDQIRQWPQDGRHLLAQYDDDGIVVYQAYRPSIAEYAVKHQRFGGDFSFNRMSWIKPNFLWMMFRAGWATKESQERILAVSIRRTFFERILERAVASSFAASGSADKVEWEKAIENSDVRLQWDPDHDPFGQPIARRAVQLGLRGETLVEYSSAAIIGIEDVTAFVHEQHGNVTGDCTRLITPRERAYVPGDTAARHLGISSWPLD
ncbi:DUF4291 domain-containing protein [Massilia sp. TW-1]|uniref:DUF4291 domain-containing protein n=1 Tax=Telluria antibiotica TaxID=2717319 RepID=A0ABX0PMH2_9BURK|nr:DUF4291 domain-containing protein [Telluria antibiotica]NIA57624.1 DUF4291 domain-containing protein [Telluria antibiotica]